MVLLVEIGQGRQETSGNPVLLVEVDSLLDALISNDVTVGKVLGDNTTARFFLLSDLITITLGVLCVVASIVLIGTSGTGNLNLGSTKLGVVQQESSLSGSLLLEGYSGILGLAS